MDSLLSLDARWTAEASEGRFKREDQDKDVANGREGGAREPPCSRIYRLLQQIVRPEWHSIPDPTSPKWLEEFQSRVEAKEPLVKRPSNPPSAGAAAASGKDVKQDPLPPQEDPAADAEATAFESFSTEEEFLLLSKITSRLVRKHVHECTLHILHANTSVHAQKNTHRCICMHSLFQFANLLLKLLGATDYTLYSCGIIGLRWHPFLLRIRHGCKPSDACGR